MYDYINGKITDIYSDSVTIECNGVGYKVFVASPYSFKIEEDNRIFLYSNIREDEYSLYGFKSKEERNLFLKLINVKGLGPKVGMIILGASTVEGISDAIDRENILYLTKFPKVGEKLARQIILDLKGKLTSKPIEKETNIELIEALTSLGYKQNDLKKILPNIDNTKTIEEQIKQALKLLLS